MSTGGRGLKTQTAMKQQNNQKMKIGVALSGGVDSAVAAKILKEQGHDLVGFFLKLWNDPTCQVTGENRCCDYEALEDARAVAAKLGIPFYVIDAKDEFKREIVDNFIQEYKHLRTPNPCVICNQKIKFDLLMRKVLEIGCDYLATGHYARIASVNSKTQDTITKRISNSKLLATHYSLLAGLDKTKDQSYNLYRLSQEQLSKIIFPLGEMTKKQVRELAQKWDLPVKEKAESQEICFFGDRDYRDFLRRYLSDSYFLSGEIVDKKGKIIGRHSGLVNYTIGQRKNINQTAPRSFLGQKQPLYVIGYNLERNQLIVGDDKDVYSDEMLLSDIVWSGKYDAKEAAELEALKVKIRSQAKAVECRLRYLEENDQVAEVNFAEPQRAVTPGQSAVFYLGDEVLGGGRIMK